jgi:hypothetical protein
MYRPSGGLERGDLYGERVAAVVLGPVGCDDMAHRVVERELVLYHRFDLGGCGCGVSAGLDHNGDGSLFGRLNRRYSAHDATATSPTHDQAQVHQCIAGLEITVRVPPQLLLHGWVAG